ncbi:hypothetical protein M422DRAFT_262258, partial [Sphaerobolus stellatus SS14]
MAIPNIAEEDWGDDVSEDEDYRPPSEPEHDTEDLIDPLPPPEMISSADVQEHPVNDVSDIFDGPEVGTQTSPTLSLGPTLSFTIPPASHSSPPLLHPPITPHTASLHMETRSRHAKRIEDISTDTSTSASLARSLNSSFASVSSLPTSVQDASGFANFPQGQHIEQLQAKLTYWEQLANTREDVITSQTAVIEHLTKAWQLERTEREYL